MNWRAAMNWLAAINWRAAVNWLTAIDWRAAVHWLAAISWRAIQNWRAALKLLLGYLLAVLGTYVLGVIFISQGNLAAVSGLGMDIAGQRLDAFMHDLANMRDLYLPLVAVALLLGLGVAAGIIRFVPRLRLLGYVSAGFVGLIALHLLLKAVLGLSGIAPTRELTGLLAQGLAGALGGLSFHLVTKRHA